MKKVIVILVLIFFLQGCEHPQITTLKDKTLQETRVSLMAVGDNLIHDQMIKTADQDSGELNDGLYDFSPYYSHIQEYLKQSDIKYINQETIIGGENLGISGYPSFNTPTVMAQTLVDQGFNVINSATNHCLDRGFEGIRYSRKIWGQFKDVIQIGVNDSEEDATAIRVIDKKGIRFAFLSYTYGTNGIQLPNDFCVNLFDREKIASDINKAKLISDVVIVSAHWGDEYHFAPNQMQKDYAQYFADLGVDVVIGEHPHVIQPMEWIEGANHNQTLIIYSLGNFVHGMLEKETQLGGMVTLDFIKKQNEIVVDQVRWHSLVNHYEADASDIMNTRHHFTVYPLSTYTDDLASQHGLNGYQGIAVTKQWFENQTQVVIDQEFLK